MCKKIFISLFLGFFGLPSFAFFDGKIEKQYFYDNSTTIMQEEELDDTVKTEKYWTDNTLTKNKYKPSFIISNNDIINFVPKQHTVEKISNAPSVYNISLKNSSVVSVSFKEQSSLAEDKSEAENKNSVYTSLYEKAKISSATEEKMNTATILKNTKNQKYYNMAISLLDDITNTEPFNAYAFYLKGELYALKQENENAMKCYVSSLRINPANKNCYISIAKMLEATNKTLAQKYYAKANGVNL